jgi:hypothetical protein
MAKLLKKHRNDEGKLLYREMRCDCGAVVHVSAYTDISECDRCGRVYNTFGQELDRQAIYGCVHYRNGWDCDCGAGYKEG